MHLYETSGLEAKVHRNAFEFDWNRTGSGFRGTLSASASGAFIRHNTVIINHVAWGLPILGWLEFKSCHLNRPLTENKVRMKGWRDRSLLDIITDDRCCYLSRSTQANQSRLLESVMMVYKWENNGALELRQVSWLLITLWQGQSRTDSERTGI